MSENKWLIDPEISDVSVSEILEGKYAPASSERWKEEKDRKAKKKVLVEF